MKGFIAVNAYATQEEYLNQAKRLKEEFGLLSVDVEIIPNNKYDFYIENNDIVSKLQDNDFCVFWDKDKYILSMIDKFGIRVFNPKNAIISCDDKMITHIELANNGIPMPKTLAGLLCYTKGAPIQESSVKAVEELGFPLIAKECYGSLGQEVYLVRNENELIQTMERLQFVPHLFQEFIDSSYGKDVRVIVVGHKVVGGMLRQSKDDFKSNIAGGGSGTVFPVTKEMEEIAIKISNVLDLDYCGIDFLFGEKGPIVCEVNSNAFFYEFEKVTKINVAKIYAEYIIKTLNDSKN